MYNTVRQQAISRFKSFHGILFNSTLTMVHDTAGEVSPDVNETNKEKRELAKIMAIKCLDNDLETLTGNWWGKTFFKKKIQTLHNERTELFKI